MMRFLWVTVLAAFVSSCAVMQNTADNNHAAVCKELKRRIIYNGSTGNNTVATQQRAELNRLNKNYNSQGC
jgi:predicted transglutaminase-like cysteine proteinase